VTLEHLYFLTMKMGHNIFIVRDYSQTCDFFRVCVCEQCYGLVLWFLLNTATSLTALLLAINYSLKWVFVLHVFIYFLYTDIELDHMCKWTAMLECVDLWFEQSNLETTRETEWSFDVYFSFMKILWHENNLIAVVYW